MKPIVKLYDNQSIHSCEVCCHRKVCNSKNPSKLMNAYKTEGHIFSNEPHWSIPVPHNCPLKKPTTFIFR
jgi:hypothetical protein